MSPHFIFIDKPIAPSVPEDWEEFGNSLFIANTGITVEIEALSSSRIVLSFTNSVSGDYELHIYDLVGPNWVKFGNTFIIPSAINRGLGVLTATRVAITIDSELRALDLSGLNWSQVGLTLAIPAGPTNSGLTGMTPTRAALIAGNRVQAYDFFGVSWAPIGSTRAVFNNFEVDITSPSSSRIITADGGGPVQNGGLFSFDFDEISWTLDTFTGLGTDKRFPAISSLSSSEFVYINQVEDDLRKYKLNGAFVPEGNDLPLSGIVRPELAALLSDRTAFFNGGDSRLRTFDFV